MSIFVDWVFMVMAFLSILIITLLRGGHGMDSIIGLEMCSIHSWALLLLAQIICFICSSINKTRHRDELVGREGNENYESKSKKNKVKMN